MSKVEVRIKSLELAKEANVYDNIDEFFKAADIYYAYLTKE